MSMKNETLDYIAAAGNRTTGTGVLMGLYAWVTSTQFLGLAGLGVALIGVLINWYYKRESNRRHVAEHELRMERLRQGRRTDTDLGELGEDE